MKTHSADLKLLHWTDETIMEHLQGAVLQLFFPNEPSTETSKHGRKLWCQQDPNNDDYDLLNISWWFNISLFFINYWGLGEGG
jgi:hypothetical protein